MKKIIMGLCMIGSLLAGCSHDATVQAINPQDPATWSGRYHGVLPCVDCTGVVLEVGLNIDQSFEKLEFAYGQTVNYDIQRGKFTFSEDGRTIVFEESGLQFDIDSKGLTLKTNAKKAVPSEQRGNRLYKIVDKGFSFKGMTGVKGVLMYGSNVSSFQPCQSSAIYWVQPTSELTRRIADKVGIVPEYTPMMATLLVQELGKPQDPFLSAYTSVIQVDDIIGVEVLTPENQCRE